METKYFEEVSSNGVIHKILFSEVLFQGVSDFQEVKIIETEAYGRVLLLDSQVQSSEVDENIYHEALVHPSLLSHPNPKRVFIGGGGEGASAREVLKYSSVEMCVMVDIDPFVCQSAETYLNKWHCGSFKDPRLTLKIADAKDILKSYEDGYFDVIILDLCDPLEYGPCYKLYSSEFYSMCLKKLSEFGVFVTQSGPASLHTCKDVFTAIHSTLNSVFPLVFPYALHIPSFASLWGFNMALKVKSPQGDYQLPTALNNVTPAGVDNVISKRLEKDLLRFYDGISHCNMFFLPKYIRESLKEEKRVICEKSPIFVSHISSKKLKKENL